MSFNTSSHPSQKNTRIRDFIKRALDIAVSLAVLTFLSPFYGLIALAIKRDSPGPVFYRGRRVGQFGKTFEILKFRTMWETPTSYTGPSVTAHDDARITPIGHWLRETKLNELPQFYNVLKGEMSLVGPRPEDPDIARTWPKDVRDEILSIRPGITSPASVQYRNEESMLACQTALQQYMQELSPNKIRLDQLYVRYRSFWMDLDILLLTLLVLLPMVGSYSPPENLLFVGPVTSLIRRHVSWLSIDVLIAWLAMGFTGLVWRAFGPLNVGVSKAIGMTAGFAFLFSLIGPVFGVNRVSWSKATISDAYDLVPAWILASIIAFLVNLWLGVLPPLLVLAATALALFGFVFARFRSRLVTAVLIQFMRHRSSLREARERVLIVGSGRTAEHIAWLLDHPAYLGQFRVVGFIDDNLLMQGMRIYGTKVIGAYKDLALLIEEYNVGVIVLADHRIDYQKYCAMTEVCDSTPARVVVVPDLFGSLHGLIGGAPEIAGRGNGRYQADFRCQRCVAKYAPLEPEGQLEEKGTLLAKISAIKGHKQ